MTKALEGLNADAKAHSVEVCWHGQDELAVTPGGWDSDYGSFVVSYFGGSGFPTVQPNQCCLHQGPQEE